MVFHNNVSCHQLCSYSTFRNLLHHMLLNSCLLHYFSFVCLAFFLPSVLLCWLLVYGKGAKLLVAEWPYYFSRKGLLDLPV